MGKSIADLAVATPDLSTLVAAAKVRRPQDTYCLCRNRRALHIESSSQIDCFVAPNLRPSASCLPAGRQPGGGAR